MDVTQVPTERLLAWLRLARIPTIGPVLVRKAVEALGSPEAVLGAHAVRLAAIEGIGPKRAEAFARGATVTDAQKEWEQAQAAGVTVMCRDHDAWPPGLKTIHDPPVVLFIRGELLKDDALAIGIVGSRECTLYGRQQAEKFGSALAQAGLTVVSGGARGIDTGSHEGTLKVKGRTVVVQGCGLANTYPPENKKLYERIVGEGAGAIVSELPLHEPPTAENFPPRNRIIAGMSLGVLVIEANLKSGSLITARLAADDYGREVFALPGRVDSAASAGTHYLIKTGSAHLVENVEDILNGLGDAGEALKKLSAESQQLSLPTLVADPPAQAVVIKDASTAPPIDESTIYTPAQKKILAAISIDPMTVDDLCDATKLPASVVMAELTFLQIRGVMTRAGNLYARRKSKAGAR